MDFKNPIRGGYSKDHSKMRRNLGDGKLIKHSKTKHFNRLSHYNSVFIVVGQQYFESRTMFVRCRNFPMKIMLDNQGISPGHLGSFKDKPRISFATEV